MTLVLQTQLATIWSGLDKLQHCALSKSLLDVGMCYKITFFMEAFC